MATNTIMSTVSNPQFPDQCPSCDRCTYHGVEKVGTTVRMVDDGVPDFEEDEPLGDWSSLWCEHCGKMFIEDGRWVIDPDGRPRQAEDDDHATLDSFDREETDP